MLTMYWADGILFTCPRCLASSANPRDAAEGYCFRCKGFTAGTLPVLEPGDVPWLTEMGAVEGVHYRLARPVLTPDRGGA